MSADGTRFAPAPKDIPYCAATATVAGGMLHALIVRQTHVQNTHPSGLLPADAGVMHEGHRYARLKLEDWAALLRPFSARTLQRAITDLVSQDLLVVRRWRQSMLYRVNYTPLRHAIEAAGYALPLWLQEPTVAQMSMHPHMEALSIVETAGQVLPGSHAYTRQDGMDRPTEPEAAPIYTRQDGMDRPSYAKAAPTYTRQDGMDRPTEPEAAPIYTRQDGMDRPSYAKAAPIYPCQNGMDKHSYVKDDPIYPCQIGMDKHSYVKADPIYTRQDGMDKRSYVKDDPIYPCQDGMDTVPTTTIGPVASAPMTEHPDLSTPNYYVPLARLRADDDLLINKIETLGKSVSQSARDRGRPRESRVGPLADLAHLNIHHLWIAAWTSRPDVRDVKAYVLACIEDAAGRGIDLTQPPPPKRPLKVTQEGRSLLPVLEPETAPVVNAGPMAREWAHVSEELRRQVARPSFDTFLKEAHGQWAGDVLVVSAPSGFAAEYLAKRMGGVIERTVERVLQRGCEVRFAVRAERDGENTEAS